MTTYGALCWLVVAAWLLAAAGRAYMRWATRPDEIIAGYLAAKREDDR